MTGKLIIHSPNTYLGVVKFNIYINGQKQASIAGGEKTIIPISNQCYVTVKIGLNAESDAYSVPANMITELQYDLLSKLTWKCAARLIRQVPYVEENEPSQNKPIYDIKGVRGRSIKVFEEKCIIKTTVTVGSLITHNYNDGEKTIYYADCIGVQFKKSGLQIGYLQLETASSTMNNRSDNFFNENSFTFDTSTVTNEQMEDVANYIRDQIDQIKRGKNAPTIISSTPVSSADELKKFKELLDMGVITQEEFDAKKKQLLGL